MRINKEKKVIEHTYFVCKASWCINIGIYGNYSDYRLQTDKNNCILASERIWVRINENQLDRYKKIHSEDIPFLIKGIQYVQKQIRQNSKFQNTLITIDGLLYSICDFQEEGLIAGMIEWCAKAYDFEIPSISVEFDESKNKYMFEFDNI